MSTAKPPLKVIFESLKGTWQLRRTLTSKLPGFPSGTFTGTAVFSPSHAFNQSSQLYHETGTLSTDQGFQLHADRKYVYRFSDDDEKLSAWFVKGIDGKDDIDYLYHDLEFSFEQNRWVARGDHLCNDDMYWTLYDFRLNPAGDVLELWGMKTMVKGPEKDYSSDTAYQRDS